MLERIEDVPAGIVAIRAVGTVTADDWAGIVGPVLEDAGARGGRLRLLLHLGPEYEGFTAGVLWEKTGAVARHPGLWHLVDGYALVSDITWIGEVVHLAGLVVPFPMRVFGNDALDEALAWLQSLPSTAGTATADRG